MFIFPLMAVSQRNDDIAQMAVQTSAEEFVDKARTLGILESSDYDAFIQQISSTGNTFDVEIEIKRMDTNPGAKVAQASSEKIGENIYYSLYTSQIEELWDQANGVINLKEGDIITITVKNNNKTIGQMFTGSDDSILVQQSGIVSKNSK